MTYSKKAQVLLTEEEYRVLEEVSAKTHKKLSTVIREAVRKVYIEESKRPEIIESINRLLSLPPRLPLGTTRSGKRNTPEIRGLATSSKISIHHDSY